MKKVFQKIKKIIVGTIVGIITLPSKVFGFDSQFPPALYGPPPDEIKITSISDKIISMIKTLILPIILLIGLIVYLWKSKSSKEKKIIITLCILIVTMLLYFSLNKVEEIESLSISDRIISMIITLFLPAILIIGLTVYLIKSKKKEKYLIAFLILIILGAPIVMFLATK